MKLFAITNRGLAVISLLVMLLWGVILAERSIIRQAQQDHYEFLRSQPAAPATPGPRPTGHPTSDTVPSDNVAFG